MIKTSEDAEVDGLPGNTRSELYEADEHAWIAQQVVALSSGRPHELDCQIVAESLEDSMKRDRRELRSRSTRLLQQLLKLRMQPEKMARRWLAAVVHEQYEIQNFFRDIPSIAKQAERLLAEAHRRAVRLASIETGIPAGRFPPTSPLTIPEALAFTGERLYASGVRKRKQ